MVSSDYTVMASSDRRRRREADAGIRLAVVEAADVKAGSTFSL